MSRETAFKRNTHVENSDEFETDSAVLRIDLRFDLDKIAAASAAELAAKASISPSSKELCLLACRIYDARRARDKMLDEKLFGEPAWDMLLALYCLPSRGEILSVTALSLAAAVPVTTGIRWQTILKQEGLIERGPQGVDLRRQTLRLTADGRALLDKYLTKLFYCATPVPPFADAVIDL